MAKFIVGDEESFRLSISGIPNQSTINYIREQSFTPSLALDQNTREFMEQSRNIYNEYLSDKAIEKAHFIKNIANNTWQHNVIRALEDIDQMQQAPSVMVPYIMAMPEVRSLWQAGGCAGYDEDYVDEYPNLNGEDNLYYRRMMDGILQETEDEMYYVDYSEPLDLEEPLHVTQQFILLNVRNSIARKLQDKGDDPTSRYNASL